MRLIPKQSRSSYKVTLISEAAIQLLDTSKSPDFTTNHIAVRAGVSVGTLYRYFPKQRRDIAPCGASRNEDEEKQNLVCY